MINEQFIDRVMGVLLEMRLDEKNRETRDRADKLAGEKLGIKRDPTTNLTAKEVLRTKLAQPSDRDPHDKDGNTEPKETILSIQKTKRDKTPGWKDANKQKADETIANRVKAVKRSRRNRPNLPR